MEFVVWIVGVWIVESGGVWIVGVEMACGWWEMEFARVEEFGILGMRVWG